MSTEANWRNTMNTRSILDQAAGGEFSPLRDDAAMHTAETFASKHGGVVRPWGANGFYKAVMIDGIDYLWVRSTGNYDGWDAPLGGGGGA